MAYICYIDEAGCSTPVPTANTDIQPVLAIAGLIVQQEAVPGLTVDFLQLKRKFFPAKFKSPHPLDDVREEIKGSDVRGAVRKQGTKAKAYLRFVDETLQLLEKYECRILATVWIKGVGKPFKSRENYTRSVQMACKAFQSFLEAKDSHGMMIADFRTTQLNDQVAHSIFTQKYRAKGDPFNRILELPTFGVSNNHVGLQLTDIICSTLLFPMASSVYCFGHVIGVHVNAKDRILRRHYAKRIKNLQFKDKSIWGISVIDQQLNRPTADLFVIPPMPQKPNATGHVGAKIGILGQKLLQAVATQGSNLAGNNLPSINK